MRKNSSSVGKRRGFGGGYFKRGRDGDRDEDAKKRPMTLRRRDSTGRAETFSRDKKRRAWEAAWNELEHDDDDDDEDLFEVDHDEDKDDAGKSAPKPSAAVPPPPKDKEEEEEKHEEEEDDDDDENKIFDIMEEDDIDSSSSSVPAYLRRRPPPPRPYQVRQIPLDRVEVAVRINVGLMDSLVRMNDHILRNNYHQNYHQIQKRDTASDIVHQNLDRIQALLKALDEWVPITVPGDQPKAVPPTIPMADGSEVRFTNVASELGIQWSAVSQEDKQRLYERAAQLHQQHYGARPGKAKMWTSDGYKDVAYYNQRTYKNTVLTALKEYQESLKK